MCWISDSIDTSVRTKRARPPASVINETVLRPPSELMSATTTFAPSSAKSRQVARPMPEPPPVTMATLSLSRIETSL